MLRREDCLWKSPVTERRPGFLHSIHEPKKRWGVADAKGNIRFNWRINQTPTRPIDYVVAHELVQLAHADHTRDFWSMLGRTMPDYEIRREALRRLGREVVW